MNFSDQLLASIEARIAEANEQITALAGALTALQNEQAPARNGGRPKRATPTKPSSSARAPKTPSSTRAPKTPSSAQAPKASSPAVASDASPAAGNHEVPPPAGETEVPSPVAAAEAPAADAAQVAAAPVADAAQSGSARAARRPKAPTNGGTSARPARRSRRVGKSDGGLPERLTERLEALLRESEEGLSASSISKEAGVGYNQVLELLRRLEQTGEVRRSGTRRTSLWRLVTDEERIAERAAELERLSTRSG